MRNRILLLLKYIHHFRFFPGVKLFIRLSLLKKETVQLKNFGKINLRKNSSDVDMFNQIFVNNEYRLHLTFEPKFIVDAGANIGLTSLYFANKYPSATIVSIEPETENFQLLLKNTASHLGIQPLKAALWINDNMVSLLKSNSFDSHSVTEIDEKSEEVAAITIKKLLNNYNLETIDILKLDVEGAEKEIFSVDVEYWLPQIRILIIELHDRFKPGCSMSFFNALQGYKYKMDIKGELLIFYFY